LSQSWGFKSQSRNWIYCIINDCPGLRGRHCILRGIVKIMVSKRNVWSEEKTIMLPLRLVENQASALNKMSALAH
jgi:hypothetical protein